MGAASGILHPSFKSALQRADEYLPADKCLKTRRWRGGSGGVGGWEAAALTTALENKKNSEPLNWTGSGLI